MEMKSQLKYIATRGEFRLKQGAGPKSESVVFFSETDYREIKNGEFQQWVSVSWVSGESPRVATSSFAGEIQAVFYGFDMARTLKGLMAELIFGNIGVRIPTFARNDNSAVLYQVDSVNTVTNEND